MWFKQFHKPTTIMNNVVQTISKTINNNEKCGSKQIHKPSTIMNNVVQTIS